MKCDCKYCHTEVVSAFVKDLIESLLCLGSEPCGVGGDAG